MKKIFLTISLIVIATMFSGSFNIANADDKNPEEKSLSETTFPVDKVLTLDNQEQPKKYFKDQNNSPIVSFIIEVIDFANIIVGSIAIILFIIAGFMFMFAQGNQQKVDEAKEMMKYVVIGLIVIFLSYIITIFVQSIFVAE